MTKRKLKPELGFLNREGRFYACHPWGHIELGHELTEGGPKQLEKEGWMVLRGDPPIDRWSWFYLADHPAFPSQAQWDFVFDWCRKKKKQFPPEHLVFLWEDSNEH